MKVVIFNPSGVEYGLLRNVYRVTTRKNGQGYLIDYKVQCSECAGLKPFTSQVANGYRIEMVLEEGDVFTVEGGE